MSVARSILSERLLRLESEVDRLSSPMVSEMTTVGVLRNKSKLMQKVRRKH